MLLPFALSLYETSCNGEPTTTSLLLYIGKRQYRLREKIRCNSKSTYVSGGLLDPLGVEGVELGVEFADGSEGEGDDPRLVLAAIPPIIAATTIIANIEQKLIQKCRCLRPHIL